MVHMTDPFRYDGARVVVTGCFSGIGEATALELQRLGAEVIGLDVKQPRIRLAQFVQLDLGDPISIDAGVASIHGDVQAIFNCAGVWSGSGKSPLEIFSINFLGTRHLTERLVPQLPDGGAVASIASLSALGWERNLSAIDTLLGHLTFEAAKTWLASSPDQLGARAYSFSKQCLIVYSMHRCLDLALRGIRFNTISPSAVETPILADSRRRLGNERVDSFPKPLGRVSSPTEQARVLAFLNSEAASYISGQNIWTDGGYSAAVITGRLPSTSS